MPWPAEIGEPLPNADIAHGIHEKLAAYSLNPEHRAGGDKARVFRAVLGLEGADIDYLAQALRAGLAGTPVRSVRDKPPHGVMCSVWITVRGLRDRADRTAVVRTVWQIRDEGDPPRLVTAYIRA